MPFAMYRGLGDDDLASIVMYLRTVPAGRQRPRHIPPTTSRCRPPTAHRSTSVTPPPRAVTVEYGAYLAGPVAHCMECHTPFGPQGPMLDTDLGRGGFEFIGPWGVSVSPNITSGHDGIGKYTDAELAAMITRGERPGGAPMLPPMPYRLPRKDDAATIWPRHPLPAQPAAAGRQGLDRGTSAKRTGQTLAPAIVRSDCIVKKRPPRRARNASTGPVTAAISLGRADLAHAGPVIGLEHLVHRRLQAA